MVYTVKTLSKLSGVTVRALHYYEELGLLKPAYYGENGYRYYEEKELLQLQQILFFKELGLSLRKIQKILGRSDFDQLKALYTHREALSRERKKLGQLIKTVDKTIHHLQGRKKMKESEIFKGFYAWANKKGNPEDYLVTCENPSEAEKTVLTHVKTPEPQEESFYEKVDEEASKILSQIAECIKKGLKPQDKAVQSLIEEHHHFAETVMTVSKEAYEALAELYETHPQFKKQLTGFHPELTTFMPSAMRVFAREKLS